MGILTNIQKEHQRLDVTDQLDLNEVSFPTASKDWKRFGTNKTVAHVLFLPSNDGLEKMSIEGKKCHYLTVKSLPKLLHGVYQNIIITAILWIVSIYSEQSKLNTLENVCKNHKFKIVKFIQNHKPMKILFVIYAATELCLITVQKNLLH